jgi:hypothetical protein
MALRTHNLPSGRFKKRLWRRIFKVGEWAWEIIICLLNVLKWDFGDVDEAMIRDVEMLFKSIFYILGIKKNDLDKVAEANLPT